MDLEAELAQLKRRVDDLEGAVNVLAGQVQATRPELIALKTETMHRFDVADGQMGRIVSRLDTMSTQVWSLRDDLPLILQKALSASGRG